MSLDRGPQDRKSAGPGRLVSGVEGRANTVARLDTAGAVGQVSQIDIAGAENDSVYSVRFQGRNIESTPEVLTDGSATQEKLRDLLIAAIELDAGVMASASSVVAGTNQLFINWLPNTAPPIVVSFPANPTTDLTLVNTAATPATQYVYGKVAEVRPGPAGNPSMILTQGIRNPVEINGVVLALAITFAGGETYSVVYIVDGVSVPVGWAAGGDADLTDGLAKVALDAALPVGTDVTISGTGALDITFTAGVTAVVVSGSGTGAADAVTTQTSAADPLPTLCFIVDERATSPVDNGAYYQGEAIGPHPGRSVLTANQSGSNVWATRAPAVAPAFGDPVHVEADSGSATYRDVTSVPSLTTIPWPGATFEGIDPQDPNSVHFRF